MIDFSLLKRLTREVCETLDHKFLLQMDSRTLTITDDDTHYIVQYRDEHPYRLPKHDVAALPIDNSTAEAAVAIHRGAADRVAQGVRTARIGAAAGRG